MSEASPTQTHSIQEILHEIVDIDIEFREYVTEGDWEAATQLQAQRRRTLETLFQLPMEAAERRQVVETLRELLASDKVLVRDLEIARDHCSQQITRMQLGRQATSSYESTGLMVNSPRMMQ